MVDVKATLFDGSFHEVDSSEMAFKIAGSMALKDAVEKADPTILEPIMRVEVTMPEEFMGDVIGDLNSRRGHIEGMDNRNGTQVVRAFVPLASMFGYVTDLRSMTQGRASSSMEFAHYAEVPRNLADELEQAPAEPDPRPSTAHHHRHPTRPETVSKQGSSRTMAKKKFERTKPHVNVGTIGHIDHGKTQPDRGHHQVPGPQGRRRVPRLRHHRQRSRGARAGHHHRHRPRRVRDRRRATTPTSTAPATRTTSRT